MTKRPWSAMIPILNNHDPKQVIATAQPDGNGLLVEFREGFAITKDDFFQIFGNAGFIVLEAEFEDDRQLIRKARILEFSGDVR